MINSVSVTEVIRSLDRRKGARGGGPSCGAMDNPVEQRRIRDFWEITRRQEEFQRELRRLKAVEVYLSVTLSLSLSLCVCVCVCVCVRVCVFVLECVFMFVPLYLHPSFTLALASWALPSQALAPRLHAAHVSVVPQEVHRVDLLSVKGLLEHMGEAGCSYVAFIARPESVSDKVTFHTHTHTHRQKEPRLHTSHKNEENLTRTTY